MALDNAVNLQKRFSKKKQKLLLAEVCYRSFACLNVLWLFHVWITVLAVSIDLPSGHILQVGLKLMA